VPESHLQFPRWAAAYPAEVGESGGDDYFEVPPSDPVFLRRRKTSSSGGRDGGGGGDDDDAGEEEEEGGGGDKEGGGTAVVVRLRAGDMLMWDSRLVHCNTTHKARRRRQESESDDDDATKKTSPSLSSGPDGGTTSRLARAVCYVCMTPAARLEEEETSADDGNSGARDARLDDANRFDDHGPDYPDAAAAAARRRAVTETGDTTTHAPWQGGLLQTVFIPRRQLM
jgi:hypothetical protein